MYRELGCHVTPSDSNKNHEARYKPTDCLIVVSLELIIR